MANLIRSGFIVLLLLSGCGWDGTPTRENDFVPLTSIEISADYSTIAAQTSTKLKVIGNFSGLFSHDVTDQVVWSSDAQTVADFVTPTDRPRVTGLIPGAAVLRATVGSVSSTFALTVSDATVTSMVITDVPTSLPKGRNSQLKVTGTFTDLTTQDLTFDAVWTSTPGTFATVSNDPASKGLVTALTEGSETITAAFGGIPATTTLTVTVPVLQSITISPANPSILTLTAGKFTATGTYSDGSSPDITSQVAWSSSDFGIATIVASGGVATATALSQGTTAITATLDGINGTTSLRATGGNLTSFTVSPTIVTLVKDTTVRMTATGTFSNAGASVTRDISGAVQWTPDNTSLATVTVAEGNLVILKALATTIPTTQITATAGKLTPFTTTLTVTAPQLQSIAISTTSSELTSAGPLTAGTSARFTATATFTGNGGTTQDVTTLCEWTSDDNTKATVGNSGHTAGRVTGVATGSAKISATYGGKPAVSAIVNVLSRVLQSLTVSPATSTVTAGQQVSYTAAASYFDGTTKDVTEDATWSTYNPNVAILADAVNQPGQVVAVDRGSATITTSFGGKTPTQTTTITVTGP